MDPIAPGSSLHFLGIGGIGVSAVARIALGMGFRVSGSDVRESRLTIGMRNEGATVYIGHRPEHLDGVDRVVVSTAIPPHNVELVEAQRRNLPVLHRSELLAWFVSQYRSVGVTGTHGKGTISAMVASILDADHQQPGFIIGGFLTQFQTNARAGSGTWMVVEVDESDGSHANVPVNDLVCNFLEADHLNYYRDLDHIIESMAEVVNQGPALKHLYVNGDCPGNRRLLTMVNKPATTYGVETDVDYRGRAVDTSQLPLKFEAFARGESLGIFTLPLAGRYNIVNAMGAIAVAHRLGVPVESMRRGLAECRGLENRFTIRQAGGITLVKDYNSHPTAIRKVLESARDLAHGKVYSVFKPYRYTLTNYLREEYATAFKGSDTVVITTMYAANEDPIPGVDTEFVVRLLQDGGLLVKHIPDQNHIVDWLRSVVVPGDQVIFFGGDDFFAMADAWADSIEPSPS